MDTVHDLPNVLYEVANESTDATSEWGDSTEWQYRVIDQLKDYEAQMGYERHPVGMTFQIGTYGTGPNGFPSQLPDAPRNARLFESPADWISPGFERQPRQPQALAAVRQQSPNPSSPTGSSTRQRVQEVQVMAMPQDPKANDTQLQHREPQPVLSVRASVPVTELAAVQGDALQALWSYLQHHGVRPAGPPFVRYHTFGEAQTDVEVGIPVAEGAVGEGRVAAGELPGGTVVSAWHLGAHDRLADAYAGLQAWLQQHGHRPAGAGWEVYHWIDLDQEPDPASWPDPSNWRTQLVQPVR